MIVIHMGCNDPIDILDDSGRRLYFGNDKWQEIYASRVRGFLKLASEKKILSFWVGLPIMSSQKYCAKIRLINSTVERECAKASGCHYVDSWSALADSNGNYSTFIKRPGGRQTRIRAKDDVHLTEAGGVILSKTSCERPASMRILRRRRTNRPALTGIGLHALRDALDDTVH